MTEAEVAMSVVLTCRVYSTVHLLSLVQCELRETVANSGADLLPHSELRCLFVGPLFHVALFCNPFAVEAVSRLRPVFMAVS